MQDGLIIETERLVLRPLDPDRDLLALHRIGADIRVASMMQSIAADWTVADAARFLDRARWRGVPGFRHAITLRERPEDMIGTIGMGGEPPSTGYFLDPAFWGQGLMSEALRSFLPVVMERFSVAEILAGHFEDNPASGKVLTKVGFIRAGEEIGACPARLEPRLILLYRLPGAQVKRDRHEIP